MPSLADHSGIATLSGSPKDIQAQLARSHAERVLVMTFDHIQPPVFDTLAENFTNVAASMLEVLHERHERQSLERLAQVLVPVLIPPTPPSPRLLKEAAMLVRARRAVLESGDWLTAAEIAQLAGLSTRNPSAQPNKWKKQGLIFALHHNGVDYFPGYGLDSHANFRPVKALSRIIEIFNGHKDGWGMAYWFLGVNSFLGGKRPQDLLVLDPERVMAAAQDEIEAIAHG